MRDPLPEDVIVRLAANPPDIVPTDNEDDLRKIYGSDAIEVIAFKRFLALEHTEPTEEFPTGQVKCPPHWMAYAKGEMDSAEVLRIDDERKADASPAH